MHHVVLNSLPLINFSVPDLQSRMEWYHLVQSLSYSDREIEIRSRPDHDTDPDAFDTVIRMKDDLLAFFQHAAGLADHGRPPASIFLFSDPDDDEKAHTVVFVNGVRLDLAAHTIVADTFVLPLTTALKIEGVISRAVGDALKKITSMTDLVALSSTHNGVLVWRQLLSACVERCRQWSHNPKTCEYLLSSAEGGHASPSPPISYERAESPICSCGRGKDVDGFFTPTAGNANPKFGALAALAPYVTRAAISPLHAVPYLERVGSRVGQAFGVSVGGELTGNHSIFWDQDPDASTDWSVIDEFAAKADEFSIPGTVTQKLVEELKKFRERLEACAKCGAGADGGTGSNSAGADAGAPASSSATAVTLMKCGKCKKVKYCSAACQKADWKKHKMTCVGR
jgi:hypothetical protein